MSEQRPGSASSAGEDFSGLTNVQASRILSSVLGKKSDAGENPSEALFRELRRDHPSRWFDDMLVASVGFELARAEELFIRGKADLATLTAIKDSGKTIRKPPAGYAGDFFPLLAYYLAHAAALAHHGTFIGKEEKRRYIPVLRELARLVPPPWSELFSRAHAVLEAM